MESCCFKGPFAGLNIRYKWENVLAKASGQKKFSSYNIEQLGPFFYFASTKKKAPSFIIFSVTYAPQSLKNEKHFIVQLQAIRGKTSHEIDFQTELQRDNFSTAYFNSMALTESIIRSIDFSKQTYSMESTVILPKHKQPCSAMLILQTIVGACNLQIHILNSAHKAAPYSLKMCQSVDVSPLFSVMHGFNDETTVSDCFQVMDIKNVETTNVYVKCKDKQSALEFMIYIYGQANTVKKILPPVIPKSEPDFSIEIEEIQQAEPVPEIEESDHEEEILPEIVSRTEPVVKPHAPTPPPEAQASKRNSQTMTKVVPVEKRDPVLPGKYAQLQEEMNKRPSPKDFIVPSFSDLVSQMCIPSVETDSKQIEDRLEGIISTLPSSETDTLFETKQMVPSEIAQNALDKMPSYLFVNFPALFDFSEFPLFNFDQFKHTEQPKYQYINALNQVVENLQTSGVTSHADSEICTKLAFLLASLFLNGLQGGGEVTSVVDLAGFMDELSGSVDGLHEIAEQMELEATAAQQASVLAYHLLNSNTVCPLLRAIRKSSKWQNQHYLQTALLSRDIVTDTMMIVLEPIFSIHSFTLTVKNNAVDDFSAYAQIPALQILNAQKLLDGMLNPEFVATLLELGLKKRALFGNSVWSLFLEVASLSLPQVENPDWPIFVQTVTEKKGGVLDLKSNSEKLQDLIALGIENKKLTIWILFVAVQVQLVEKYYEEDGTLLDPYRLRFFLTALQKALEQ